MADTENKQAGGPQAMLRGLLVVVAVAVIAIVGLIVWGRRPDGRSPLAGTNIPAQQVAMLDSEAIYALPEFKKAKEDLDKLSTDKEKELVETIQAKHLTEEEAEKLRVQMRDQLQQEQAKRVTPLNRRVTAAIASLAKEKNYRVVLDKRIVVTGVADVTADVKKKFDDLKNADLSKETEGTGDSSDSNVGYVNQDVIGDLRLFKEAQQKLYVTYQDMYKNYTIVTKDKPAADKEKMRQEMVKVFQEKQAEVMKPVNDRVTTAITDVAKEKGLSLVLNSHHIMWGGRNLTDDVIKKLI